MAREMDIRDDAEMFMDEDEADMLKAAAYLLAAAAVKKANKARAMRRRIKRKRVWVRKWLLNRPKYGMYEKLMNQLRRQNVKSFRNFTRMEPSMFDQMVKDLTTKLKKRTTSYRKPLSPGLKLAITLRYLVTRDSYKSLSYGFRVAPSTIVNIVLEVCQALYEHYHESAFKCPTTAEEWTQVAQDFSDKWNFPHCCGGIDGKHVRIQAPPNSGSRYYNYKGFYSIIMSALVDANYKFMYVDVSAWKSWAATKFTSTRWWLWCPLLSGWWWCIFIEKLDDETTFKENHDSSRAHFNYRLYRVRRIVENAFGILANRYLYSIYIIYYIIYNCRVIA